MGHLKVALVIPYYKGEDYIFPLLRSIDEDWNNLRLTVFIINNDEKPLNIVEEYPFEIIILKTEKGIGFARAVNFGVYHAISENFEILIILNQDTLLTTSALENLGEVVRNDHLNIYSPVILDYHKQEEEPVFTGFLSAKSNGNKYDMIPATCWALSSALVKKFGLFDPVFYHFVEERDFLKRNDLNVTILDSIKVHHEVVSGVHGKSDKTIFDFYNSKLIFAARYGDIRLVLHWLKRGFKDLLIKRKNVKYSLLLMARIPFLWQKQYSTRTIASVKERILRQLNIDSLGQITELP